MHVGLTYDLKAEHIALGVSPEDAAEFDKEETIAGIEAALRSLGHETDRIGHARALVKRLEAGDRWDAVFNICEGLRGVAREAQVPAILELYDVPYVFSDPLVLAMTLHKGMTKRVVRDAGVPTSDFCVYETAEDLRGLRFGAPFFVKPVAEGTGKGCSAKSIVRDPAALPGVCDALVARFGQPALVEPFLAGREFTVGITGTGRQARILASMEIVLLDNAEKPGALGKVVDINLLYTTLQETDGGGRLLQIPNALFFQRVVRRWPSDSRGAESMVIASAGHTASHSLHAMQRSSPLA